MIVSNSSKKLADYGSINDTREDFTKSIDYYKKRDNNQRANIKQKLNKYKSDSFLNYLPTSSGGFDTSLNLRRDSMRSVIIDDNEDGPMRDDFSQTSGEIILSQTYCKCSYIVEPVAFIQNLATSIMGISLGQFIYNRILTRLINEFNKANFKNSTNRTINYFINHASLSLNIMSNSTTLSSTSTTTSAPNTASCQGSITPPHNASNGTNFNLLLDFMTRNTASSLNLLVSPAISDFYLNTSSQTLQPNMLTYPSYSSPTSMNLGISPEDFERIRNQAQSETAHLYFVSALFSGIPVIIMTNLLGVNCSTLGRKTLMLIYLSVMTVKFTLILLQCLYPEWPDWLFYLGAFIEGISGSGGVFYLSLYCYIADLTSPSARSYRITLLNNLNSVASLCVTFLCGYVIKYYGYVYLFLASLCFMVISLVYTIFLIPEPLVELRDMNIFERLKLCSVKRTVNCFKVYFSKEEDRCKKEQDSLIETDQPTENNTKLSKQTFVLLLIVFANFVYNFGTIGIGSIFTLFIMNAPYCFDSVQISNYSVFSTVISLFMSLFVSKFIKINDVLICILSVGSYFASVLCYIYGNSIYHIYLGAIIASIAGLEYGYVRSIVSKSVEKNEVADALSLILIVDTFIAVVSSVIFPVLYSSIVSKGIGILFSFSNGFVLMAFICHM